MKPCPFCGAMLTEALVRAIVDPTQSESCPSQNSGVPCVDTLTITITPDLSGFARPAVTEPVAYVSPMEIALGRVSAVFS